MKKLKYFENFFYDLSDEDKEKIKQRGEHLKSTKIDEWCANQWKKIVEESSFLNSYEKKELLEDDVIEIIAGHSGAYGQPHLRLWTIAGENIKELLTLFDPKKIEFYNYQLKNRYKQDSHIKEFYKDVDDFVEVLKRLREFMKSPDSNFISGQILAYCAPPTLRYFSEESMKHILANKHLYRKFQQLFRPPLTAWPTRCYMSATGSAEGWRQVYPEPPADREEEDEKPFWDSEWNRFGIRSILPTSYKMLEDAIVEIILDDRSENK